jgi:hypothetical protein
MALEGGEGSASRPGRILLPGKTRYPLCGPQDRSGQVRKISPPPGFDPRTAIKHSATQNHHPQHLTTTPSFSNHPKEVGFALSIGHEGP